MLLLTVLGLALTVSTVNGACVASYKKYELKHVAGGTSQGTTANTLTLCQAACDGNNKCAGYDFTNANVCWLVLNPDTPITDDAKADHYRRITTCTKAEAICVYEYIGPYSATTLQAKTGDLCSDDCNGNPACKGFFTSTVATNPCNTLSDVATGVRTEVATNTLYKQVSCNIPRSAVCAAISYFEMKNKHVSGGKVDASGSASVTACQGVCSPSTACIGIDYVPGSSNCYIITNPKAALSDQTGTNNYAAQRECTTGGTTCKYQRTGSYVPSGTKSTKTASQTFDQCATLCNNDGGCTQFAYNAKTQDCVTSTGTTTDTTANADNTMYTKTTPCPVTTTVVTTPTTTPTTPTTTATTASTPTTTTPTTTTPTTTSPTTVTTTSTIAPTTTVTTTTTATTTSTAPPTTTSTTTVTTVSTGTTTPGCVNVFTETKDRSSIGGMQDGNAKTVDACKKVCADTAACVAFDFVVSSNQCWINKDIKNLDDVRTSSGINQYKIERCVKVCNPAYASKEKTSSMGGIKSQVTISVLDDCKKVCTDDKACLGFDFGPGTQCWIHSDAEKFKVKKTSTESTQYTITRCDATSDTTTSVGTTVTTTAGCKNEFKSTASRASSGGVRDNSVTTLEACKNNCAADDKCVGFDYTTTNQCWIHPTKDNLQKGKTTTGVTQYEIVRCVDGTTTTAGTTTLDTTTGTPACINKFTPTAGRSSTGGVRNNAANTVDLCKKACGDESKCVAFDYITSSNQCWLHNAIANLNSERSTADSTQYKIQRCVQPCKNEFKSTASRASSGGVRDNSVTTLEACKTNCVADDKCVGFDYTTTNQCWIHPTKDNLQKGKTTTGVTQYEIVRCVDGTTTTAGTTTLDTTTGTPACINKFTPTAGRSSTGGVRNTAANTVDLCKKACGDESKCVAFDYITSSNQCWLHNAIANLNDERSTADATQYKIQRCVQPCKNEFKSTPSRSSDKAVQKSSARTLEACKALCVADEKCVGFDYTTSNQCWIHENKDNFNDQRNTADSTQYVIERCVDGATTTATPTGTGGTTGTPACIPSWDSGATGISSSGGLRKESIGSVEQCQNGCVADKACLAIDFSSTGCYFHLNADFKNNRRSTDGTSTQYILTRCVATGCVPSWDAGAKSTSSTGGVRKATLGSLQQCQVGCVADKACLAIDFSSTGCYFHLNADFKNNKRTTDATSTQYILTRCAATGCPEFKEYKDVHALGGIPNAAADTLAKCQDVCDKNSDCQSIDFTAGGSIKCYILTMEKKPGTSDLPTLVGTNHYTLVCRTGQTKPTAAPTPTTPACINQWAVTAGTHSGGGKFNGAARTLLACRKLCADDANCLAIDFNDGASPKECWMHTVAASLAVKRTSDPNINQNIISRCTGGQTTPSTTSSGCAPSFTKTDDVHGKGGKLQTGVNTLAACQANCVALASCVALDFTDANACWFFEAAGYATEADTANTHYIIKRCTDVSTTPAGVSTTPINIPSSGGTTRAPCVTYSGATNMKASGGFTLGIFTDLDSCQNGCSSSPGCFGINFIAMAVANQRCELVFSSSGVASSSGYTYYAATRCDATTTQAATTTRAP